MVSYEALMATSTKMAVFGDVALQLLTVVSEKLTAYTVQHPVREPSSEFICGLFNDTVSS
jgi:hypothetical protein